MYKKILLPTDGSDLSNHAIDKAILLAAELGAEIIGLTVTEPFHYVSVDTASISDTPESYDADMQEVAKKRLQRIRIKCDELDVDCLLIHKESMHPYEGIVTTAEESKCDIIFMASHGRRGISSLLLGSEVNKVLTHTKIPVLVYR